MMIGILVLIRPLIAENDGHVVIAILLLLLFFLFLSFVLGLGVSVRALRWLRWLCRPLVAPTLITPLVVVPDHHD